MKEAIFLSWFNNFIQLSNNSHLHRPTSKSSRKKMVQNAIDVQDVCLWAGNKLKFRAGPKFRALDVTRRRPTQLSPHFRSLGPWESRRRIIFLIGLHPHFCLLAAPKFFLLSISLNNRTIEHESHDVTRRSLKLTALSMLCTGAF